MTYFYRSIYYQFGWTTVLYIIPCVFFAMVCHEYFKARTAKKLGCLCDERVYKNPLKFISVIGYIFGIISGYCWGKAQPCNIDKLSKGKKVLYYFSGSIANIVFALIALLIQTMVFVVMLYASVELGGFWDSLHFAFNLFVWTQIFMAVTQLLPIPTFSGYAILKTLFFEKVYNKNLAKVESNGKWIFVVLVLLGVLYYVNEIPADFVFNVLYTGMENLVDLITGGLFTQAGW